MAATGSVPAPPLLVRPASSATLLLRRLPAADLAALLDLLAPCGVPPDQLRRDAGSGALFALLDVGAGPDEAVAGALVAAVSAGRSAEVVALAVAPASRGTGLGGRLLREVIDVLRAEGVRLIRAAPAADPAWRHLCQAAGFAPVEADRAGGFELEL